LTVEWIALRRAEYAASVHLTTGTDERRAHGPAGGDDDRRGPLDVPNAGGGDPSWTRFRRSRRAGRATRRGPERIHGTADVRYRRRRGGGDGGRPDAVPDGHDRRRCRRYGRGQYLRGSAATGLRAADAALPAAHHGRRAGIRIGDECGGREVLAGPFQGLRGLGMTAVGLGAITLLLAMAGLYGIQSHIIANRTREIGVRMSSGATAGQIKRMVLVDGYRLVLDGLIFGLSIGLVGRAIARAYLELDVAIVDPWMLVVTPIPLICAAFFACYLPARRAAAVDPNVALRSE